MPFSFSFAPALLVKSAVAVVPRAAARARLPFKPVSRIPIWGNVSVVEIAFGVSYKNTVLIPYSSFCPIALSLLPFSFAPSEDLTSPTKTGKGTGNGLLEGNCSGSLAAEFQLELSGAPSLSAAGITL
jgi:hypothetical protein